MNSLDFRRAAGITALLGTGLAAALWLTACHSRPTVSAPPAVVVARPVHPDGASGAGAAIRYPVEVAARYSNSMSFRVPGKLIERDVRIGDSVKQGQVVARLDPTDAQKQAASARAALQAAEHRLLFAKQQLDRDSAQAAQNLIATNQLEQTQDAFTAAEAAREEAAAQLAVARNNLEYNTLAADHDGVITSENADTGQVVVAGQAVYGLAWSGAVDVTLDAANSDLGEIGIGQTASVTFPALPGRSFEARVREVAPLADPQSRTYRVKLTLAQPDPAIRLGMTGDALLLPMISRTEAPRQTYTVPSTALFHEGNSPAVFVVSPGTSTLELRRVTVTRYSDHSSLITSGLRDGDTVVFAGVHAVYPGERVTAVRPLFDSEGDVAGPAPSQSAPGSGSAGVGP